MRVRPDLTRRVGFWCACSGLGAVVLGMVLVLLLGPGAAAAPHGRQVVSCIPSVQGPIPISSTSAPYVPRALEGPWPLAPGYVEQEFFVSCTALGQRYKTRVFLRRPRSPHRFSGTVVTEVPDGPLWTTSYFTSRYEMSAGIASIIVESVPGFLDSVVKPADPTRYASLHIPDLPNINYEIEAQVGALLKANARDKLLSGLHVRNVIFAGYSGSAAEVRGYIAHEHFQVRLRRGRPIYDGYFPQQTAVGSAPTPIPNLDVPVVEIQGERELINTFQRVGHLGYRRADGPRYRLYEVPAQPHLPTRSAELAPFYRGWTCVSPRGPFSVADPTIATQFWHGAISDMGLRNLVRWVADGVPAPSAARIRLIGHTVVRDRYGNAVGGVRSSYVDVPFASYAALSINYQPGTRCDMIGYQFRLGAATLKHLYPTHASYVRRVRVDLARLQTQGWITAQDAAAELREAARANVP